MDLASSQEKNFNMPLWLNFKDSCDEPSREWLCVFKVSKNLHAPYYYYR